MRETFIILAGVTLTALLLPLAWRWFHTAEDGLPLLDSVPCAHCGATSPYRTNGIWSCGHCGRAYDRADQSRLEASP